MTDSHRAKIREGVLTKMYGPEWRKILAERRSHKAIEHILGSAKAIEALKASDPEEKYGTPYMYDGPSDLRPMGKQEFMRILTARLRDSALVTRDFVALAAIYAEIKGWARKKMKFPRQKHAEQIPAPDAAQDCGQLGQECGEEQILSAVQQIEEARKGNK